MANLQPRTTGAYEAYVASAEVAFLTRVRSGEPVAQAAGASIVGQTTDGRIVKVPNGLVHHWRGAIHVPGVGLERVIATAQRYDAYTRMYKSVVEARLLHRDGDRFCVLTRLRGSGGGMTVVLEVRSVIRYERQATAVYSLGVSQDIQEAVAPVSRTSACCPRAATAPAVPANARVVDRADRAASGPTERRAHADGVRPGRS